MLARRRVIYYGGVFLAAVVLVLGVATTTQILLKGRMVVAPASLNGMVTISMSPDKKLTFITCAPYHATLSRRLLHSTLLGAFVAQHTKPTNKVVAHTGRAHIEFESNLLRVVFADSSQFVFTTEPTGSIPLEEGEVDYVVGIATYGVAGFNTHADFVASRNWTKRSCDL